MAKFLLMAASIRKNSCNKKLINLIAKLCSKTDITVEILDFANFLAPAYDGDLEEKSGLPAVAQEFIARLKNSDGLIISSPEYNFSTPGTLKNLLDWVSRARPMPIAKYPIMLCSASPSLVGGNRGLLSTVTILQACCNAYVFPPLFSLANAYEAFTNEGSLKSEDLEKRLAKSIIEFAGFVSVLTKSP